MVYIIIGSFIQVMSIYLQVCFLWSSFMSVQRCIVCLWSLVLIYLLLILTYQFPKRPN